MGLESAGFRVTWANDNEPKKKAMYDCQFGRSTKESFVLGDIAKIRVEDVPGDAKLGWASFPCTDLSLAGQRAGLSGHQSGTFWHFVRLMDELGDRRPEVVVLENVVGFASSHGGDDLTTAVRAFNSLGYSIDVLTIDARRFLPQSRPRLFLVGIQDPPDDVPEPNSELRPDWLQWVFGDKSLRTHRALLPAPPPPLTEGFSDIVETMSTEDERWWDESRCETFVASLSPTQLERVAALWHSPDIKYRTAYRRTRNGTPVWEVRPDDIAGCLRTARGGSSKQAVVRLGDNCLQARWMTPLEYARLMGAEDYDMSAVRDSQALFGFGDAVAVPAVAWLAENYLMPVISGKIARNYSFERKVSNG